jgi:hypothetical protein
VENWIISIERSATYEGNGNERREADKIYGSQQNHQGGGYHNDPQYKMILITNTEKERFFRRPF